MLVEQAARPQACSKTFAVVWLADVCLWRTKARELTASTNQSSLGLAHRFSPFPSPVAVPGVRVVSQA